MNQTFYNKRLIRDQKKYKRQLSAKRKLLENIQSKHRENSKTKNTEKYTVKGKVL